VARRVSGDRKPRDKRERQEAEITGGRRRWWLKGGRGGGGSGGGGGPSKLESRRPRRGKQRTALIEANAAARTPRSARESRVHTRVSEVPARSPARSPARARAHVRVGVIDPIPGVDPSESRAVLLPPSPPLPSLSRGRDTRIPVPATKAETREDGRIPARTRARVTRTGRCILSRDGRDYVSPGNCVSPLMILRSVADTCGC